MLSKGGILPGQPEEKKTTFPRGKKSKGGLGLFQGHQKLQPNQIFNVQLTTQGTPQTTTTHVGVHKFLSLW